MSHARKHVLEEALNGRPEPSEHEAVVKVIQADGGYLYKVQTAEGRTFIGRLPAKFRKLLWVKPGTYVIVEVPEEDESAVHPEKLQGEIQHVLYEDQIKNLKEQHLWPAEFDEVGIEAEVVADGEEEDEAGDDFGQTFGFNPNRQQVCDSSSEESDEHHAL